MTTSPIPQLQANLVAAQAHVNRVQVALTDAEVVAQDAAQRLAEAVAEDALTQFKALGEGYAADVLAEALAEKAGDRRRDAEADRADALAELREAVR